MAFQGLHQNVRDICDLITNGWDTCKRMLFYNYTIRPNAPSAFQGFTHGFMFAMDHVGLPVNHIGLAHAVKLRTPQPQKERQRNGNLT